MNRTVREMIKSFLNKDPSPTVPLRSPAELENHPVTLQELWNDFDRRSSDHFHYKIPKDPSALRLTSWIGTISYSGHTRERSLRNLIAKFESGDENRILLRLTDWVPEVRALAGKWLLEHFRSLPPKSIHQNQRMIRHLSGKETLHGHPALLEIHRDLVLRATAMPRNEFAAFEATFRHIVLAASIHSGQPLRDLILADKDPANRLLILSLPPDMPLTGEEKSLLASDKSVRIRKAFFLRELERHGTLSADTLTRLALDPSRSLRSIGQFHLRKSHGIDAYELYKAFTDERFFYIADYAKMEDSHHFFQGIYFYSAKVRIACLRALAICDPTAIAALDLPPLIIENAKQRQIIAACLPKILTLEEILPLQKAFEAASPEGILTFLHVLERKSFWHFIDHSLDCFAAVSADPRFETLRRKMDRPEIPQPPSPDLRDSIYRKIPLIEATFPLLARNLRFSLKDR